MAFAIFCILNGLVVLAIIVSMAFWAQRTWVFATTNKWPALVPLRVRDKPTWSVAEFLVMFGLMILSFALFRFAFNEIGWIDTAETVSVATESVLTENAPTSQTGDVGETTDTEQPIDVGSLLVLLTANMLAGAAAMGLTIAWITQIQGGNCKNLGLDVGKSGVWLGLKASVWFIPPVLLISLLASWLIPYSHPALDYLTSTQVPGTWVLLFVGTAIVVPLSEEFMFRVLLQGGLQKIADPQLETCTETKNAIEESNPESQRNASRSSCSSSLHAAYRPPIENESVAQHSDTTLAWKPVAYWPIVVTSVVFAAMHLGQGAAPIPLFFLSLGLGYLYRQTGRLIGPFIVHMVLNSLTLLVEFSRAASS